MICPTCKRTFTAPDPRTADPRARSTAPFCSARCRSADLGNWLDGNYRIATPASDEEPDNGPDTDGNPSVN